MTKIDIISGFLGAGKTTFIKKMIEEVFKGEKIVLIENEFGEVGIDGGFLKDAGIEITEMNSGCICCSLVGDFGKNLHEVIEKFHPDRILIEPSGVGKLSDVMKSVIDVEKDEDVKLNGLITVVNALKASKQMKAFGEFFNNQIEYATTVVLSRSQKATPEQLAHTLTVIRRRMQEGGQVIVAVEPPKGGSQMLLQAIETDGKTWWAAFSSFEEELKGGGSVKSTFLADIEKLFQGALQAEGIEGVILNPWNRTLMLDKSLIQIVLGSR